MLNEATVSFINLELRETAKGVRHMQLNLINEQYLNSF